MSTRHNDSNNLPLTVDKILSMRPEELASTQYSLLMDSAVAHIDKFKALIEDEEFSAARELLTYSPAGDGYGDDSYYLDMSFLGREFIDVASVLDRLIYLKFILDKKEKTNG